MQTKMNDNATSNAQASTAEMQDDDEISLLDFLQVVVDNLRLLVLGPLVCGLTALGISFAIAPTFTAKTQFLPPQQQQSSAASMLASLGALGGLAGAATGLKSPADQYIAFLKSVTLQDALIERFKLIEKYEAKIKTDARLELTGNVRIASGKDGLISVEVDDKDPNSRLTWPMPMWRNFATCWVVWQSLKRSNAECSSKNNWRKLKTN